MISFLEPIILLLLIPILVVAVFIWSRQRLYLVRIQRLKLNFDSHQAGYRLRLWSWFISCVFLVIALARPIWGTELEAIEAQGVSIMFVLDVSKSMDAEDLLPSRLERAKLTLEELLMHLSGHEMGLILFAAKPIIQFPLTIDTIASASSIKNVTTNSAASQGTNIADAIQFALKSLEAASSDKSLIILLTDGEGHSGDLESALFSAIGEGVIIYTIGYGTSGGALIPIHNPDGSMVDKRDQAGNQIISKLDEQMLRHIAKSTGGIYVNIASESYEAAVIVRSVDQYAPIPANRGVQSKGIERFDIFLFLALAALMVDSFVSRLRKASPK